MNATPQPHTGLGSAWSTWVADSVQMGLMVLDDETRVCLFNRWMVESSGLAWEQVVGKKISEVFPEISSGRVGLAIQTCLVNGLAAVLSNSLNPTPFPLFASAQQRALGIRRQQSVRIMRSPRTAGAAVQVLIEVVDVSAAVQRERKLQELNTTLIRSNAATRAALRDNEALLTTINQYAIVSVTDRDGTITDINEAFCTISGYTRDELLGKNHRIVSARHHPPEFWSSMWKQVSMGQTWRGEVCNRSKYGTLYWEDTFISPFFDESGQICKFISIHVDITASKQAQQELKLATEAAQEASRSKSQFLANMSHEIRTPMNAILGMLRLLHSTELTPRQLDYASKSEGAAKSLLGLLNDILDFSKIDAGKMTLDPQPFRVDRLLRDLSVIVSANIGNKPLEVLYDIDPEIPKVLIGDALRLQQVLINLSGNALKFTHSGEIVIQLKVIAARTSDVTLRVSVQDSGIGIAAEHLVRIFDGFAQAEASTTRRYGGTGLGLSISRHLVALMGGELAVNSTLGQGSTFYFTLTLPKSDQAVDDPTPPRGLAADLSVLVVDDNTVARELLASMAKTWGWRVNTASGGVQALAHIEARRARGDPPYQIIVVDWHMPEMDGWETIARIEAIKPDPALPMPIILMVTAQGREMLAKRTAQEQARLSAFLVKPITPSMLFDAVADAQAGLSNLRARPRTKSSPTGRLKGMHLLLVEDNPINQQVADELLRAEGAFVEIAENGQLGLDAIANADRAFDAVLMDLQMPVMDGYTATRFIRNHLGLRELPVIAMTANAMASDRVACLAAGMNDHVGKPFDLQHLVEVLQRYAKSPDLTSSISVCPPAMAEAVSVPVANTENATTVRSDVDVGAALSRLGGNIGLYQSVVDTYLRDLASLPDQLEPMVRAGDMIGANRLLHTYKGLSATVGASHMATVTKALESALRRGSGDAFHEEIITSLRKAVASTTELLNQVGKQLTSDATSSPMPIKAPHSRETLTTDLKTLHDLLARSDMRAISWFEQIQNHHGRTPNIDFEPLRLHLSVLDFVQAMEICRQMLQLLEHAAQG